MTIFLPAALRGIEMFINRTNDVGDTVEDGGKRKVPFLKQQATGLDLVEAGWRPTVENYLGRVTKTRIIEAVREGAGDRAADLIAHLKKGDMAKEAERLLADTGWLPEPLRRALPDVGADVDTASGSESEDLPDFLAGEDDAPAEDEDETQPPVAAE